MFKVVGIVQEKIRIEFSKNEEPFLFSTEEEAEEFKAYIRENEVCPDGCKLEIEAVKEPSETK